MNFLGVYRHVHSMHAKSLTGEMFVSLGMNAVSGRDVYAEGGLIALAEGKIRNKQALVKRLKLPQDASGSLIVNRAYRMWGADYPRQIDTDAVTAVIDRAEDRLILASGRMGAAPVFYSWRGRSAAFASHPDFLLKMGVCGRGVDKNGLRELFLSGGMYTPGRTPFRDIRVLEPGCVLVADSRGTRVKRYADVKKMFSCAAGEDVPFQETLRFAVDAMAEEKTGVLLADGYSEQAARILFEKAEARTYRLVLEEADNISERAKMEGFSHTDVFYDEEDILGALGEANLAQGFPGCGIRDAYMFFLMKRAFQREKNVLLGGRLTRYSGIDTGDLLNDEVRTKLLCDTYEEDRLNEEMDKFHFALHETEEETRARRAALAYIGLPSYFMRAGMLASYAGGSAASVMQDAGVLAQAVYYEVEQENGRGSRDYASAPVRAAIVSAAEELISNTAGAVYSLLDRSKVQKAMDEGKIYALSRLLQIDLWLSQYEAEILFF